MRSFDLLSLLTLAALTVSGFPSTAVAAPVAELSDKELVVRNLTPGSAVALLAVAHEPAYYMMRVVARRELLKDDDKDGVVRYVPDHGVAFRSIWIVVDVASGESAMTTPAGYEPVEMYQRGAGRGQAVQAIVNTLDIGREAVEILLVRPGEGAWFVTARDRGFSDQDGQANGRIRLNPRKLRSPQGAYGEGPHAMRNGDVVAMIDPDILEYWWATMGRGGN
jgi:hypothetical protein